MAVADYATQDGTTNDLFGPSGYLRDVATSNAGWNRLAQRFLHHASRLVDHKCQRFFYDDGYYVKYFDGDGTKSITLPDFFPDPGAPTTNPTTVQLAYFENETLAQWLSLTGDGLTPPTNFMLWPRNPMRAGSSANTSAVRPYLGIDLPTIPKAGTSWLPVFREGYLTVAVTAHWGWPAVPDVVKEITVKVAARMWRAREAGWAGQVGNPDGSVQEISRFFDAGDMAVLKSSDLVRPWL